MILARGVGLRNSRQVILGRAKITVCLVIPARGVGLRAVYV